MNNKKCPLCNGRVVAGYVCSCCKIFGRCSSTGGSR